MSQEGENYCYLIGLNPYLEERYSAGDISNRIDAAEARWKKEAQDTQRGDVKSRFRASARLEMVSDMRSVMSSNVLRKEEFENGRTLLQSKASKLNKDVIVLHDGSCYLLPDADTALAKRLRWGDVDGKAVLRASGIVPVAAPKPAEDDVLTAFEKLQELGLYTSTELLNTLIEMPAMELEINRLEAGCRPADIREAFGSVERRLGIMKAGKIENQDAYIQAMRALKIVMFPDEKLAALDKYGRCMRVIEPAMDDLDEDYGQPFSANYLHGLISIYCSHEVIDNEMATVILESYCCKRRYIANFSAKNTRFILCPACKAMVTDSKDIVFCPVCSKPLRLICPRCGTSQPSTYRTCAKCGVGLDASLKEARARGREIQDLIGSGDVATAEARFSSLQEEFPNFTETREISKKIGKASASYNDILSRIDNDYRMRNLFDLKTVVEDARRTYPKIMESEQVAERYSEACDKVAEADAVCKQAECAPEGDEAMELYIRAATLCPDHPNASRRLRDYPPEGPADASCQVREDTVLLRYAVPVDRKGVSFCIYRGKNSLPEVDQSTVPLAEIPGGVFHDKTLDPGVDYYYKIYSRRWGILSHDFAQCGPAMVLREVEGAEIETIEDGLRITYPVPRGCSRVRIWRKEDGTDDEEVEVQHQNNGRVEDRSLKGETSYHYLFVVEYDVNGRTERSLGSVASGRTAKYPEPVNDMEVSWNRTDGSYSARWGSQEKVVLYASRKKSVIFGTTVPVEDVDKWMTPIRPTESYEKGCKFELPDGAVIFLYPMVRIGRTVVRGRECMITNLRPFRDVEKKMDGGDCDLTVTWPEGAESAVIVVDDPGARDDLCKTERITVSRDLYEKDGRIRIQMGMSNKKTVTLFAVYDVEGTKMESIPFTMDVYSGSSTKIRYRVHEEKVKEDRNLTRIIIDLEAAEGDTVPRLIMTSTNIGIPLRPGDGEIVWDSVDPVALQNGRAQTWFTMEKSKADISKMRLFFPDKEEYCLFKLIHPLYKED